MKKILLILVLVLIAALWIVSRSDWHVKRNKHNKLPVGNLKQVKGDTYQDEEGLTWELQPQIKNKFHQPKQASEMIESPYTNIDPPPAFDKKNPNLKFLCKDDRGGSYEAILQPDGKYLTTGSKQGTYNYSNPSGFFGSLKHFFLDVLPHFFNSKYKN